MQNTKEFEFALKDDKELKLGEHKWFGKEDQTEEKSIHDKGKGEPVVIRLFEFKFRLDLDKLPTKEELLTPDYMKFLNNTLWGDGLRIALEPRVQIAKEGCKIFVPCVARTGQSYLEEPKMLQEWLR